MTAPAPNLARELEAMATTVSSALRAIAQQVAVLEALGIRPVQGDLAQHKARFPECVAHVLKEEGGFVQHPSDPGGATNFGITHRTLAAWRGKPVTVEDVRRLTVGEAKEIYEANYFLRNRCDQMPPGVDLCVFDFTVNSGRAVMVVQDVLGVKLDGAVGPQTLAAIQARPAGELVEAISAARLAYLRDLGTWAVFGRGWANRVERVRKAALAAVQ